MPRAAKADLAVPTNMALNPNSKVQQREALARIAFGESWKKMEAEIDERLVDFEDDAPIRQSTRRALVMIQDMMFDKL